MRLHEAAEEIINGKKAHEITAVRWLTDNDERWELRKRRTEMEHRLLRDESGEPIRNHYLPHIPISADVYGRTWKDLKTLAKATGLTNAHIWEKVVLPLIEKHIKEIKK